MQHAVTQIILALMGQALGEPARVGRFRRAGRAVLLVLSLWFILSTLIWARQGDEVLTIFAAIERGAPAWMLVVPLAGAVSIVLLWLYPRGLPWLLLFGSFGLIAVVFAVVIAIETGAANLRAYWGAGLNIVAAFIYMLAALVMAFGEPVPVHSPLVHLAYPGIVGHLRSLYRLGEKWGWTVSGPEGPLHAVHVSGRWGERNVGIESGTRFNFSAAEGSYHVLRVAVSTNGKPRPFFVGVGGDKPSKAELALAQKGSCQTSGHKQADVYLWPIGEDQQRQDALRRLEIALNSGSRFLRKQTILRTLSDGLLFERRSMWRMTENEQDMEAIVRWLSNVARTMEEQNLVQSEEA